MTLPRLAITLGDPAGIGPETIVRAWREPALHAHGLPFVVGHPEWVRRAVTLLGSGQRVVEISQPDAAMPDQQTIPVLPSGNDDSLAVAPGSIDGRCGQAAYDALVKATHLALAGDVEAIVTAPLCKESLHLAGHHYPGHTELLAELCGVPEVGMLLYLAPDELVLSPAGLGVVHVTLHVALRDVWSQLTIENIVAKTELVARIMGALKEAPPRIGVTALNPHAGEGGLFGDEEERLIRPAVALARAAGIDVHGPLAADTLFTAAAREGRFDGLVAMYHDQGHIALKLLGFHRAVNVTLGLPIIRTSVAHGTAFDRAWQGLADCRSLLEAVRIAAELSRRRVWWDLPQVAGRPN